MSYYDKVYHRVFNLHLASGDVLPAILPDHVMLCLDSQAMKDEIVTIEGVKFYYKAIEIPLSEPHVAYLGESVTKSDYSGVHYLEKNDTSYEVSSLPYFLFDQRDGCFRQSKNSMGKVSNASGIMRSYTIEDHVNANNLGKVKPDYIFATQYAAFTKHSKETLGDYFSTSREFTTLQNRLHTTRTIMNGLTLQN